MALLEAVDPADDLFDLVHASHLARLGTELSGGGEAAGDEALGRGGIGTEVEVQVAGEQRRRGEASQAGGSSVVPAAPRCLGAQVHCPIVSSSCRMLPTCTRGAGGVGVPAPRAEAFHVTGYRESLKQPPARSSGQAR